MAKSGDKVCCRQCGRDTTNKTEICSKCYGYGETEQRGRKIRDTKAIAGTPIEDVYESNWYEPTSDEAYHGGSIRDDL